ncbi:MAG: hypothetical protein EHM93_19610 [Bacteroidales bacterium]|nr:MAG: hypothetical protein EHM93_19610 [Bacteroidales bacterium]
MKTMIAYLFGFSIVSIYIYMSFISKTIKPERYKFRIIFGLVSMLLGVIVDCIDLFDKPFGFFIIIGFTPFIYLICYEVFRIIYRPLIGKYPYAPYRENIGNRVYGTGYPITRTVKAIDYLFTITLLFGPIIIMILLLAYVV